MQSSLMLKNPGDELAIWGEKPAIKIKKHRARSGVLFVSKNCGELFETLFVWSKWKDQWINF